MVASKVSSFSFDSSFFMAGPRITKDSFGVGLPFTKIFTLRVTKMSTNRIASQRPMFIGVSEE
jgi:hypothetical protein